MVSWFPGPDVQADTGTPTPSFMGTPGEVSADAGTQESPLLGHRGAPSRTLVTSHVVAFLPVAPAQW